ncbi:MAG: hypothetical protein JWM10_3007 [Myxococcaceae bacterium]|nr:hypothetical protein [Myxococcaceae bacterium]
MSDTLGRVLRRNPAATPSGLNLFQANRALTSLAGHVLTSDLNHLGADYAYRVLATHPGWTGYWAGPFGSPSAAGPVVSEVDWTGQSVDPGRTANACLGAHWVVAVGAGATLPRAVLRCRARAATSPGSTAGIYFGVAPGRNGFPSGGSSHDRVRLTSSSFANVTLKIELEAADLEGWVVSPATGRTTSGPAPMADTVRLVLATFWVGAYNSTNKHATAADVTDLLGVTLSLEP